MNRLTYILRSLSHHRRANLGVALGAAVAATVLAGALLVGDSVSFSLQQMTRARLGKIDYVMTSSEHFFQADLAARLPGVTATAALLIDGVTLTPEGDARINAVQLLGVDDAFWALAPGPTAPPRLQDGAGLVNRAFADRLPGAADGRTVILRARRPDGLPADLTLTAGDANIWSRRLRIAGVVDAESFGNFTLRATQITPPTVFVPRAWLSAQLELGDRANLLCVPDPAHELDAALLQQKLDRAWRPADVGLQLLRVADGTLELRSERIFIKPSLAAAALRIDAKTRPIITYFVNAITANNRRSPYAFVAAPGPPRVPPDLAPDRILINDWLATDLNITRGDVVRLEYYAVDTGSRLTRTGAGFTVEDIVPTAATAAERSLAPDIPGLSDIANCRDWDPGIPIDLNLIRDKDQEYWDSYGPLPRAFISLTAAESLWRNRFGAYTALRFPSAAGNPESVSTQLVREVSAAEMGLSFRAVKEEGLAASRNAVEFGPLFTGLSFFLIAAAVLLTVLLFSFNIQRRITATGTLRALGFTPRRIAQLLLAEGLLLVAAGALLGGLLAPAYNALVLLALQTIWHDAVRTASFQTSLRANSLLLGMAGVAAAALAGMLPAVRGQTRGSIRDLQHNLQDYEEAGAPRPWLIAGLICLAAAAGLLILPAAVRDRAAAGIFFGAGALLLSGLLIICQAALLGLGRMAARGRVGVMMLILRGPALKRGRSLACIALMALGVFLVIAVAANRRTPDNNPDDPAGGAGGYRLWCETTLPLQHDLNSKRGRTRYGLSGSAAGVHFTQLRMVAGDDASCLNLNRVTRPHLLGLDPAEFARRGAFTFARLAGDYNGSPWHLLEQDLGPDTIPAFADYADIVWGMGKKIGDTLDYRDENGQPFRIMLAGGLANSIFQGHLLISAKNMAERFPAQGGTRILLVAAPADEANRLSRLLTERLGDTGLAAMTTRQRLAEFNSVENTYLAIFMLLGGLGLLLGSTGMGLVAARNILERRSAWALLRAVGFRRRQLYVLVFAEHALLAGAGVGIGSLAALTAMLPTLMTPGASIPRGEILATLAGLLLATLLWILLAVRLALRGNLTAALREE